MLCLQRHSPQQRSQASPPTAPTLCKYALEYVGCFRCFAVSCAATGAAQRRLAINAMRGIKSCGIPGTWKTGMRNI